MLNELAQVVTALERLGTPTGSRHPRINPMGKNRELLIVCLSDGGTPASFTVVPGETSATLVRVEHGSAGSSFPGFNLPTPLRTPQGADPQQLKPAIGALLIERKNTKGSVTILAKAAGGVLKLSAPRSFTANQEKQFARSVGELVAELQPMIQTAGPELENLRQLLKLMAKTEITLALFSDALVQKLATENPNDRATALLIQDMLFGALDWKKQTAEVGAAAYWEQKAKQDKNAHQPVYLDVVQQDHRFKPVAHPETSRRLNDALLAAHVSTVTEEPSSAGVDAYSGEAVPLQEKYAGKTVAHIANFILFSVNTTEVHALRRYGLEGSGLFAASAALAQKMSDALLYLASDAQKGKTCIPIPSAQPDKRDLLLAYLEEAPDFAAELAEMFGGEAQNFNEADFRERTQGVLQALEGKLATNPDLNIRLLALCSLDKGRKQLSLHRRFRAAEVVESARLWKEGSQNTPSVSIWFYDKVAKNSVFKSHVVPHPLDVASTLNRVWSTDAKTGFSPSYQRAVSAADAYDVFLAYGPLSRLKTQRCLGVLLARMALVLGRLGAVKTSRKWTSLGDTARWQCAKAVSLLGIFLEQLEQRKDSFMKEPVYQLGQLLALADSLHQQYCKHVRGDETPTQLIGNALFNTALQQPVFALARLAERLAPYQAWAKTFRNTDPNVKSGWEKTLLRLLRECTSRFVEEVDGVFRIRADELPQRMTDLDKAKLLLGYLADTYEPETKNSTTEKP
jgi:hypothetical protein